MQEDTRRGSLGSLQRPSRWSSPETSKARSDFLVHAIPIHKVAQLLQISEEYSHLAVGKVEVVTHLHRQRSSAAAAEAHDAVLAASVRHVVDCEHSLASRVCLKETKNNLSQLKKKPFCFEVYRCEGVLTTMSLKLSVFGLLLSVLWISNLCRLIPLTFTSWTCLETKY